MKYGRVPDHWAGDQSSNRPSRTVLHCRAPSDAVRIRLYLSLYFYPHESEGICFHRRLCVCVSVCLSVTTITKKIVDGFVPNFMGRFLGGKGRPSSSFVTIGGGIWK